MVLAGALMFAVGCDPGWAYHVPYRSPGAPEVSRDQGGVGLLVRARLSTGMLSVEIGVTNDASVPLLVREAAFRVLDASGRPLPWYWGRPPTQPCDEVKQNVVRLDRGQVCTMRETFQVHPNAGIVGGRNKTLRTLTVVVDGLARSDVPISRSATLEWD